MSNDSAEDPAKVEKRLLRDKIAAGYKTEESKRAWWYRDGLRDRANGWPEVYHRSRFHCVYCGKDITISLDDISAATTDHVVPQHLFPEVGGHEMGPNHLNNLVTACAVCNSIKAGWTPGISSPAWDSRQNFIQGARAQINAVRKERENKYKPYIGKGAWMGRNWDPNNPHESDFVCAPESLAAVAVRCDCNAPATHSGSDTPPVP